MGESSASMVEQAARAAISQHQRQIAARASRVRHLDRMLHVLLFYI